MPGSWVGPSAAPKARKAPRKESAEPWGHIRGGADWLRDPVSVTDERVLGLSGTRLGALTPWASSRKGTEWGREQAWPPPLLAHVSCALGG